MNLVLFQVYCLLPNKSLSSEGAQTQLQPHQGAPHLSDFPAGWSDRCSRDNRVVPQMHHRQDPQSPGNANPTNFLYRCRKYPRGLQKAKAIRDHATFFTLTIKGKTKQGRNWCSYIADVWKEFFISANAHHRLGGALTFEIASCISL